MQEEDFKWFLKNHDELFRIYGNTYLAIKNKQVIGTYASYAEAVKHTLETENLGTFIVQKCTGTADGYTNQIASSEIVVF